LETPNIIHLINIAVPFREGFANLKRPPSGILYVGGYLKKNGFDVKIHHIHTKEIERTAQQIALDNFTLFAGFSVMTGKQVAFSAEMSAKIKSFNPEIIIVWGGIHPSLMPHECLEFLFVDYIVIGEGEITTLELANCLALKVSPLEYREFANKKVLAEIKTEDIKRIGFKKNGELIITPGRRFEKNMDNFRQDWELVGVNKYVRDYWNGKKTFCFITSRGCPHSCGFCYNQEFNKRRWRKHSLEFVVHELLAIQKKTGIDTVSFDDDNYFTDKKRGIRILRELKKYNISCRWVDLRIDDITEELIPELVKVGVKTIFVGWESGSQKTLDKISKKITPQAILEKTKILSKFKKLTIDASAIIGFPWENDEDIDATISLGLKMFEIKPFMLNFNIGIYIPFPGAPTTIEAKAKGFEFPKDPNGWLKFDILSGEMELPWMDNTQVKKYTLIDKYFKLLYVFPFLKLPLKQIIYIVAILAYIRLKTRVFFFPFEVWLTDLYKKRVFKKLEQ